MGIVAWIIFGLIAGAAAKFLLPGRDPGGCLVTSLIGIAGALIGGFLGTEVFNWGRVAGFDLRSFLIAIGGAVLLLTAFRVISPRRRR